MKNHFLPEASKASKLERSCNIDNHLFNIATLSFSNFDVGDT